MRLAGDERRWLLLAAMTFFLLAMLLYALQVDKLVQSVLGTRGYYLIRDDIFSEQLIVDSLKRYAEMGDADLGGFMVAFEKNVHIAAVEYLDGPGVSREVYPYISNFNGQYLFVKPLIGMLGLTAEAAYGLARFLALGAMTATVCLIGLAVRRQFGGPQAVAVLATFCLSGLLLMRSGSVYWLLFLTFLPFAASLALYPGWRSGGRFWAFLGVIGGLVFLKSLTGYEYLSNIAMSAAAPVLYHELRLAGVTGRGLRIAALRVIAVGVACVAGFGLAVALHILKIAAFYGDIEQGLRGIRLIASYSTLGEESGIRGDVPVAENFGPMLVKNFLVNNFHINLAFLTGLLVCVGALFAGGGQIRERLVAYLRSPLCITTTFALVASLSWSVLAVKHSVGHPYGGWTQQYLALYVFLAISLAGIIFGGRDDGAREG